MDERLINKWDESGDRQMQKGGKGEKHELTYQKLCPDDGAKILDSNN